MFFRLLYCSPVGALGLQDGIPTTMQPTIRNHEDVLALPLQSVTPVALGMRPLLHTFLLCPLRGTSPK